MNQEFYDWLAKCPVDWFFHGNTHHEYATYAFTKPLKDQDKWRPTTKGLLGTDKH